MKKILTFAVGLVLVLASCSGSVDRTRPVFATDNISGIAFYSSINRHYPEEIEVPREHLEEITAWIGTFRIGEKSGKFLPPGTGLVSFKIEYLDGTVVESELTTIEVDGVLYYMDCEKAPRCYMDLMS